MAQLTGLVVSDDDGFKKEIVRLLRAGSLPVSVLDSRFARDGSSPDVIVVDIRGNAAAIGEIDRVRASHATAAIFAVASEASPDLILRAMRAGANEFLTWPPQEAAFQEAIGRMAARRESAPGAKRQGRTLVFFGVKGGAGTTTLAVNCAVELARLSKRPTVMVDLKPGLGEVGLFLGVRSRYTVLDAIDNLHRLDGEFLRELVVKHKSGLDLLAGSDQFERPGAGDSGPIEEVFRLLAREYEYIVVDAGTQLNSCSTAALYTADTAFLVANPDVACVRNAQRLIERIGQMGACADRLRVLLNRAAEPYPIPPAQIESALGQPIDHRFPSDYRTVSTALNAGVPLTLTENTELATQFDRFTRRILDPDAQQAAASPAKRIPLGFGRIASLW
jgi:pilus assembly protein CpaE